MPSTPINRAVGTYTKIQLLSGQQSAPIACPAGSEISVTLASATDPGGAGLGNFDYSTSAPPAVLGGTGTWVNTYQSFAASTATPVKCYQDCYVRFNCTQGSMIVVVDPGGSALPLSTSPFTVLTSAQLAGLLAVLSGGSVNFAPSFLGLYGGVTFDAGVGNVMPAVRAVLNAGTDVIAGQQITEGGAQAVTSSISGASSTGAVMVLSSGTVPITSVHLGHVGGANQTLSADTTITTNELVNFAFDAADAVTIVRINLAPPRSSGRYIDCTMVGTRAS